MDFWKTVVVLFRRWYVVLPAFLLSIGATALVYTAVESPYTSYGVLVLNTPKTGSVEPNDPDTAFGEINPLLNFDQGLSMAGSIIIQALGRPETAAELGVHPGDTTRFRVHNGTVNPELMTSGPFIVIEGESLTAAKARSIVYRVIDRIGVELALRQQLVEAPKSTYITIQQVVAPTTPEQVSGSNSRAAVAALGIGMVASVCGAYAAESFANRRRRTGGDRAFATSQRSR